MESSISARMRARSRGNVGMLLAVSAMLIAWPATAHADTKTMLFEAPTYAPGVVNLQDGWSSFGAAGVGCATYDHKVEKRSDFPDAPAAFGNQFLRISNGVTSGCFGDQTYTKQVEDEAGETAADSAGQSGGTRRNSFVAQFDFTSASPASPTPGLSMSVSPDRGDGARMSYVRLDEQGDGKLSVAFDDYSTATGFAEEIVAADLPRDQVHTVRLEMDFVDGPANDVVRVYVDGTLRKTGTSWEDYFRDNETPATSRTVDSVLFRTGGTAAPANMGKGYLIDNVQLRSGPDLGPAGPAGADGNDGSNGTNGTNGTNGQNGANGAQGPKGDAGQTGSQGPAGEQGLPAVSTPADQNGSPMTIAGVGKVSSKRTVKVKLTCPTGVSLCEGFVTLKSGRKTLGRAAFLIRSGKTAKVSVKLSSSTLQKVKAGKLTKATVGVFSRDRGGNAAEATGSVALKAAG